MQNRDESSLGRRDGSSVNRRIDRRRRAFAGKRNALSREVGALLAVVAACAVCGCGTGASDANYNPQRGISTDISASLNHGPTAAYPGMAGNQEPMGAFPWDIGERQGDGP